VFGEFGGGGLEPLQAAFQLGAIGGRDFDPERRNGRGGTRSSTLGEVNRCGATQ